MADTTEEQHISFENAIERLETIVTEIEDGKVSLEESIERYAEGTKLIRMCRSTLDQAETKIKLLSESENGELENVGELRDIKGDEE